MNRVDLIGRLTEDVDLKKTGTGTSFVNFRLAVERYNPSKEDKKEVAFINCVGWQMQAEYIAKYGRKGQRWAVAGYIQTGSYQNREGKTVYTTDVVAENIEFCDGTEN